ncbi:hypothetical protein L211DRAFT_867337 [Terfezia boudieri ATCC MYA-4762]|uniref:Uncharacterized protein n=1 Tax=Terfezia boudieri ATCC MYA-4762 TaxID=1051890 RepID=A0A3N4LW03_9PEZI|nr:hypothetical protein L211DRAFT_867337 [Terfezia boudieri ATCC MYA-4762]
MSSPAPPSSPFTPRSKRLSNSPASNHATPTRHSSFPRHVSSSSTPLSHTAPAATNPTDEFGLDDDNDDDLISTVGGGVYIDEDVDMDKEGNSDDEQDGEDVTEFSELDADMTVFANLRSNEGSTVAQAQQDVLPSSSQPSGGGVSVSTGIIEEGEGDDDNDTGTEIMDQETGMSPVQHFATLGNGEAANASQSAIMLPIRSYQRPQTPIRSSITDSPTPRAPSSMARLSRTSSRSSIFSMISPSSPSRHAANSSIRPFQERDQSTQLLIDDFTAQFNAVNQPPEQRQTPNHHAHSSRGSISDLFSPQPLKSRSATTETPIRRSTAGTPDNNRFFIDFDIPPPPTPRSIPSVTLREVEKLKSGFLTQFGELKAQLSGKDAEVLNLRESLREAESRCGDLREEVETLEQGKADVEGILAKFRAQAQAQFEEARREWDEERERVVTDANEAREKFEAEIEMVRVQFGEMERMSNEAREKEERMRQELEATKKEMEIVRSNTPAPAYTPIDPIANRQAPCANCANGGGGASGGASKEEVDRIAKELHVLYKQKHETKVAALKKSYEQRWEKKVKALESEIETLKATPPQTQPAKTITEVEKLNSKIQALTQELEDVKAQNENKKGENKQLKEQVQKERREKGELVGAVEEMLALQMQTLSEAVTAAEEERHETRSTQKTNPRPQPQPVPSAGAAPSRSSGLAKPGTLKVKDVKKLEKGWEGVRRRASGIGITALGETGGVTGIAAPRAGASGLAAPRAGGASALRGGIERMGRGAGPTKE